MRGRGLKYTVLSLPLTVEAPLPMKRLGFEQLRRSDDNYYLAILL